PRPVDALAQPDDLHPPLDVRQPPLADVGHEQAHRVRAAVDGGYTHGPSFHHSGRSSSASLPNGLLPGTASSCATSACRHFTRFGMPPALCIPRGSGSSPSSAATSSRLAMYESCAA